MCSRKYNIRLCLEYILEDVLLMNRAKTTAGPPSFAPLCSLKQNKTMHNVIMPIPNFWWSQYPSVSMIYTSEAGRYLTVHGMRTDPKWTGETTPPSSTRLRLVLIPLGSLEARVSDHQLTTRYLETLEYRH